MSSLEQQYDELKRRYGLPEMQSLEHDFRILEIEHSHDLLESIREKIEEKIDSSVKLIENILQPDTTISNLYEYRYIDERKKRSIYKMFKKLMMYLRYSQEVSHIEDTEKTADFIRSFISEWPKIREDLSNILSILKESWKIETDIKEDLSYFG